MPINNKKRLVFICYGGGHIELFKSIIPTLVKKRKFEIILIPLTAAVKAIPEEGISGVQIMALSEFTHLFDENINEIFEYGLSLFDENFNPTLGLKKYDTIFYLGLSMFESVRRYGKDEAFQRYKKMGRQSFLPVRSLKAIFTFLSPDIVFTTNSPRFEAAALVAAEELEIKSFQLLDLFGDGYPEPSADYIFVLNENVARKLKERGISKEIFIVGQPVFDDTVRLVSQIDRKSLRNKLGLSRCCQVILFSPTLYFIWNEDLSLKEIRDINIINKPMFDILDQIVNRYDVKILIRPHPVSDNMDNYLPYIEGKKGYLYEDIKLNVLEAIAISDICLTHGSTIAIQALICGKRVITYNYDSEQPYFWPEFAHPPFKHAETYQDLESVLMQTIEDDNEKSDHSYFYKPGAAEKILNILESKLWNS